MQKPTTILCFGLKKEIMFSKKFPKYFMMPTNRSSINLEHKCIEIKQIYKLAAGKYFWYIVKFYFT
ncbi:hypothetical protein SAMN05421824_1515 [Hyunsoonleella jejuensis]|uniref:Uncharacterized protein n=1 Tax=Hyunsoonleella jejuensis TaxID=419940 RepID=A0A1H9FLT7_9FLAO|nr:hypothetical protein SAMN05421824_1515 [Hyunsoonleella jejuensis]